MLLTPSVVAPLQQIAMAIVPAHGVVDVVHAMQTNQTAAYALSNAVALGTVPPLIQAGLQQSVVIPLLLITSAFHFRHQFAFLNVKHFPLHLVAAAALCALTVGHEELLFPFIALVHVPHQLVEHQQWLRKWPKLTWAMMSLVGAVGVASNDLVANFATSPFAIAFVFAHVLYQETIVKDSKDDIFY
mmetsp:Transcript_19830/g.63806  ORF Transcript_19830/g.63806 Transcript_19830/m.63806 type:complete len:187 (-) Transcript_19830:1193-1753(-)